MSTPGGRARRRTRSSPAVRLRAVAPPVGAVALLVVAALVHGTSDDVRPPGNVTVAQSSYACPGGAATVAAGQVRAGTGAAARTIPDRDDVDDLSDADRWRTGRVDGPAVLVQERGRGAGAVGFFAATADKKAGGGLRVGSCPSVVDDSWFLGLGSGTKHVSSVLLTNTSSSPAVADVALWGPEGPIDAVDAAGLVVDPFSSRRVTMDELAAGEDELAVHVTRRRGSLSVLALDQSTAVFRGTEAPTSTGGPVRDQVVAGLPAGKTGRSLLVLNPGDDTARVDVQAIGPKGPFVPKGLESVKVKAGRLAVVDVPGSGGDAPVSLRLRSDQPVSASARISADSKDRAYVEAVPMQGGPTRDGTGSQEPGLEGPAVVPLDFGDASPDPPTLELTAPRRSSSARVDAYDASMRKVGSTDVDLPAGTTQSVDLAKVLDGKDAAYVVVRPSGTVLGAATYRDGSRLSSLALTTAPITALGPQVRPVG